MRRDDNPGERHAMMVPDNWLRACRRGLGLVVFSLLIMDLAPELFGFALPLFNGSHDDLVWARYIRGAGRLVGVTAVLLFTYHSSLVGSRRAYTVCRRVVQVLVAMELPCLIWLYVLPCAGLPECADISIALRTQEILRNLAILGFLATLSRELTLQPLTNRFTCTGVAYSALLVCDYLTQAGPRRYIQPVGVDLLWTAYIAVWLATLRLLVGLRKKLFDMVTGACVQCGYLLCGSPSKVCPECGKANPQVV
jgi:hypothetical protein